MGRGPFRTPQPWWFCRGLGGRDVPHPSPAVPHCPQTNPPNRHTEFEEHPAKKGQTKHFRSMTLKEWSIFKMAQTYIVMGIPIGASVELLALYGYVPPPRRLRAWLLGVTPGATTRPTAPHQTTLHHDGRWGASFSAFSSTATPPPPPHTHSAPATAHTTVDSLAGDSTQRHVES